MPRRFVINEKTDSNKSNNGIDFTINTDNRKHTVIRGYYKFTSLLIAFTFVICFRAFVIDRVIISGNSMNNTFNDGDICWVKKYGITDLKRYDVVIAKVNNKYLIKRVVGLPGEKIRIDNGKIYINGNVLEESYNDFTEYSGITENEYLIDNESYFLLGDNREYSVDSRYFGSVSKKNITGVVIFRFYPFTNIGPIDK